MFILEESLTSLEEKLSRDFRYLNVNTGVAWSAINTAIV